MQLGLNLLGHLATRYVGPTWSTTFEETERSVFYTRAVEYFEITIAKRQRNVLDTKINTTVTRSILVIQK